MASSHDILSLFGTSSLSAAAPCLKLCYLNRAKLVSLPTSSCELSFSQLLSLVAHAFPETQRGSSAPTPYHRRQFPFSHHIELSYRDEAGDSVVIDSDESLNLAAQSFQKAKLDIIKLQIHVKDIQSITSDYNTVRVALTPLSSYFASSHDRRPRVHCRHFQAGSCKFGLSCSFLHDATCNKMMTSSKSGELLGEFEIHNWMMTQKCASEDDNISYFSSQEGNDTLMLILNRPELPKIAIHQLVGLLTRPKFRTSLHKQATDKIYNCLVGSQFLAALPSHIRTNVKPILGCVEPYVILCEEIIGRTSNGWKEVPLDELKALVDEVQNSSARELNHIIAHMLDQRARNQTVDEEMGALNKEHFDTLKQLPT